MDGYIVSLLLSFFRGKREIFSLDEDIVSREDTRDVYFDTG